MQTNKVNQWLENTHKGVANQEVLFINASKNHTQCNLAGLKHLETFLTSNVVLLWLDGVQEAKYRYDKNQIIIISSQDIRYFEVIKKAITRGVIYVDESNTINKIIAMLQAQRIDEMGALTYTLLKKVEFEEVLKLDIKSLREFVLQRDWLLKNIDYGFIRREFQFLDDFIAIYNHKKILVASFAQYLYRLAALDFTSTDKSVGGAIRKTLGVKSGVISPRALKVIPTAKELRKNLRVYNLNENQVELDIKISIAKKLVALDIKELDISKIANITELAIKQIEKFYRDCFIR